MADVKFIVRTADQTRKAEVEMDRSSIGSDIIQAAVDNWALPADTDYALVNVTTGKSLVPMQLLDENFVKPGDVLEVQPVLVAGAR
jgi:hypothetical protein